MQSSIQPINSQQFSKFRLLKHAFWIRLIRHSLLVWLIPIQFPFWREKLNGINYNKPTNELRESTNYYIRLQFFLLVDW